MVDQVSITPEAPQDTEPKLSIGGSPAQIPQSVINNRAAKYEYGLGSFAGLDTNQFKSALETGQEWPLRQSVAAKKDAQKWQNLPDLINQTAPEMLKWRLQNHLDPENPDSVFETGFADQYMSALDYHLQDPSKNSSLKDAVNDDPTEYQKTKRYASAYAANQEIARREYENRKAAAEEEGWGQYAGEVGKSLLPFYLEQKQAMSLGQGPSLFGGEAIKAGIQQMMSLEPKEFAKALPAMLDQMDPTMARDMAEKFLGYSLSDQFTDNFFSAVDLGSVSGVGKLAAKGYRLGIERNAIKQLLKSVPETEAVPIKVVTNTAIGDVEEAAVQKATGELIGKLTGAGNPVKESMEALPDHLRVDDTKLREAGGGLRYGQELVNRILESSFNTRNNLMNIMGNIARVLRTPAALTSEKAAREIAKDISRDYPGMDNQILNTSIWWNKVTNTLHYDLVMGAPGGKLFESEESAREFIEFTSLKGLPITVEQQGAGWYLNLRRPLSEVGEGVRDTSFYTKDAMTPPMGWSSHILGGVWKTPEETLSMDQRMARKVATYAPGALMKLMEDDAKEIKKLAKRTWIPSKKQRWQEWDRVNASAASHNIKDEFGLPGKYFDTIADYEEYFQSTIGHLPDEQQIAAYFAYKRQMAIDHFFRNAGVYRFKSRVGAETHMFKMKVGDEEFRSPWFDGVIRTDGTLPRGADNSILIADDIPGPPPLPRPDPTELGPLTPTTTPETTGGAEARANVFAEHGQTIERLKKYQGSLNDLIDEKNANVRKAKFSIVDRNLRSIMEGRGISATSQDLGDADKALLEAHTASQDLRKHLGIPLPGTRIASKLTPPNATKTKAFVEALHSKLGAFYDQARPESDVEANWRSIGDRFKTDWTALKAKFDKMSEDIGVTPEEISQALSRDVGVSKNEFEEAMNLVAPRLDFKSAGAKRKKFPKPSSTDVEDKFDPAVPLTNAEHAFMNPHIRAHYEDGLKKGIYRLIEIYDPESRPLNGFWKIGDQRIRYVIAKSTDTRPLTFNQVPRRGGGHFDYDYEHYIKQGKVHFDNVINKHWYEGDTTVMPISNRAMGWKVVGIMERARAAIAEDNWTEAQRIVNTELHIPWSDFRSWFEPQRDARTGKMVGPRLSKTEPFQVVPQNRLIADVDNNYLKRYPGMIDGTKTGSLARQYQVEYTGQRDSWEVYTLNDVGSKGNPLFQYMPAKRVDTIPSMNRALSRIINSTWGDDYKLFAMEHWLEEAKMHLNVKDLDELRAAPFHHFFNTDFQPGTPPEVKAYLEANRFKIKQFTGIQNKFDLMLHSISQKMADSMYNKFGPRGALVPTWLLPHTKDPWVFLRSYTFNSKMGMYNPAQFAVHLSTFMNVLSLSPKNASSVMAGSLLYSMTKINRNPAIVDMLEGIATKMGWAPNRWKEAWQELEKTGFKYEPGSHALRDDTMTPQVIRSKFGDFLHSGQIFFRTGVQMLRYGSWMTAFKEFRDAHPSGVITELDRQRILERADIFSHNMSRASSSVLHTGIMSPTMQFSTYFLRLNELMWGHRLTGMEKARLFGINALMYGFPTAVGLSGLPLEMYIRQWSKDPSVMGENAYIPGENFPSTLFMEGVLSTMMETITGEYKNVGPRFGPEGNAVGEALIADKPTWQVLGGASSTTLVNTIKGTSPFWHWAASAIRGEDVPLTHEDVLEPWKEIASVNATIRLIMAFRYHEWVSKNEDKVMPITTPNAIINFISGLQDIRAAEAYGDHLSLESIRETNKYVAKEFIKEMHRSFRAAADNDWSNAQAYRKKALSWAQYYPQDQIEKLYEEASRDRPGLLNRLDWQRYMGKDVPPQYKQQSQEYYNRKLRVEDKQ